jgi:hypothetical protein
MITPRVGKISIVEGEKVMLLPCTLHEVPTLIETFKSHNHINLIKAGDVGQAFIVHSLQIGQEQSAEEALNYNLQILMNMEQNGELPQEMECGLTPPMAAGCALSLALTLVSDQVQIPHCPCLAANRYSVFSFHTPLTSFQKLMI